MSLHNPEKVDDAWPHTQTVLFVVDSNTCFGEPIEDLISEIKNCRHLSNTDAHHDSELSGKGAHFEKDRAEKLDEIIPKSLLFIDVDILEETKLGTYLEGNSIPKPSEVVIVSDESSADPEKIRHEKRHSAEIARSKDDVLNEAEDYFKRICPECSGDAAKEYVKVWKQSAYHRINN
jgi:hypothetical protein